LQIASLCCSYNVLLSFVSYKWVVLARGPIKLRFDPPSSPFGTKTDFIGNKYIRWHIHTWLYLSVMLTDTDTLFISSLKDYKIVIILSFLANSLAGLFLYFYRYILYIFLYIKYEENLYSIYIEYTVYFYVGLPYLINIYLLGIVFLFIFFLFWNGKNLIFILFSLLFTSFLIYFFFFSPFIL
jgi:hypothetical protein